jgi:hypothetical protein
VKAWVAGPVLFFAVRVSGYIPPFAGVPEMVAVPLRLSANFSPAGSRPVLLIRATGLPVVVIVKVYGAPKAAVAAVWLLKMGL